MVSLPERRRCVTYLKTEYAISERRACQTMQINRSSYRYVGGQDLMDDAYQRVVGLSDQHRYWGYRKIFDLMKGERQSISRERVRLIRRREGWQVSPSIGGHQNTETLALARTSENARPPRDLRDVLGAYA